MISDQLAIHQGLIKPNPRNQCIHLMVWMMYGLKLLDKKIVNIVIIHLISLSVESYFM